MITTIIFTLFKLLELAILIECISSWIPQARNNKFIETIHNFIYPMLEPFKILQDKLIPRLPMDFSPIMAILVLDVFRRLLLGILI